MVDEVNDKLLTVRIVRLVFFQVPAPQPRIQKAVTRLLLKARIITALMFAAKFNVASDGSAAALGRAHVTSHYFGT